MSENRRRRNNGAQNKQVKKARTNNARRILLLVGLMSLVAVISIGGTIAWLTDKTDAVTNTFTVGDINIELTETGMDQNRSKTFHIVPGVNITKDPTVKVKANSEQCYLFVKVEENNWPTAEKEDRTKKVSYSIATGWNALDSATYPGVYYQIVKNSTSDQTFGVLTNDTVTVDSSLTKAEANAITVNPTLVFTAYACQYEGFEVDDDHLEKDQALAAWNAAQPTTAP